MIHSLDYHRIKSVYELWTPYRTVFTQTRPEMEISGMQYELTLKRTCSVGGLLKCLQLRLCPARYRRLLFGRLSIAMQNARRRVWDAGIVRGRLNYGALRVFIAFGNHTGPLFIWRSEVPYGIVFNKHICSLE